jgi:hypothetical protein
VYAGEATDGIGDLRSHVVHCADVPADLTQVGWCISKRLISYPAASLRGIRDKALGNAPPRPL